MGLALNPVPLSLFTPRADLAVTCRPGWRPRPADVAYGRLSLGTRGPRARGSFWLGCLCRREGGHDPTAIPWLLLGDGRGSENESRK